MPWGKVDDNLYDHPKLDRLGRSRLPSIGLHFLAISWCNRWLTDGSLPRERVLKLGGTVALADLLVHAGLWERDGEDYRIHDFLDFNQSRDQVVRGREQRSEAGRIGGRARWRNRSDEPEDPPAGASSGSPKRPRGGPSSDAPSVSSSTPGKHARARPGPARPDPSDSDEPQPRGAGHDGEIDDEGFDGPEGTPRELRMNPRALGTNPRAVAAREAQRRRDVANELQMRYLRGELTEDQHRQARIDAGLA